MCQKGENAVKSRKVIFRKSQKTAHLSELHWGSLFRTFNSYSLNFNGALRKRRTGFCLLRAPSPRGKQFLWFLKIDLLRFIAFTPLWLRVNFCFFAMCLLRINLPNLCPNMIHIDALDFSGWHSKEVISFLLTLSVYIDCTGLCLEIPPFDYSNRCASVSMLDSPSHIHVCVKKSVVSDPTLLTTDCWHISPQWYYFRCSPPPPPPPMLWCSVHEG